MPKKKKTLPEILNKIVDTEKRSIRRMSSMKKIRQQ